MSVWDFESDNESIDDQPSTVPVNIELPYLIKGEDDMAEKCEGIDIGCQSIAEIRAQSLQSFTNAGRTFDVISTTGADGVVFYNNILKAAAVNEMRELGALESRANERILGQPG